MFRINSINVIKKFLQNKHNPESIAYMDYDSFISISSIRHEDFCGSYIVYMLVSGVNDTETSISDVVYVGKTRRLKNRIKDHKFDKEFDSLMWFSVPTYELQEAAESLLIKAIKPKYNKCFPATKTILNSLSRLGNSTQYYKKRYFNV